MNFRQNWRVLALYTLLTWVFTYPVGLHLNSRIEVTPLLWTVYGFRATSECLDS